MLKEVQGYVPGQGPCTCLLEIGPDARFLLIHLAPWCTVALLREDVFGLSHLLANAAHARVPVRHGGIRRELRIKPYEGALPLQFHDKPVALHLMRDVTVVFRADELRAEAVELAEELDQAVGRRTGRPAAR